MGHPHTYSQLTYTNLMYCNCIEVNWEQSKIRVA
jgi:hypothetical protein